LEEQAFAAVILSEAKDPDGMSSAMVRASFSTEMLAGCSGGPGC
jgi:hypothetical protein